MHTSQSEWDAALLTTTLHEIQKHTGLSQTDIGTLAGRDRTTVSRWLQGRHQPDVEPVTRLTVALRTRHPEISDLIDQFVAAAGYQTHASVDALTSAPAPVVEALRERARVRNQSLGELLVREGLVGPEELLIPDVLPPDKMMEEIMALDIPDETKANLIRLHLENRAQRVEEKRLGDKKPDGA